MHLQRNATQRNAYQNYILNNNFKFYIFQFFRAFNFLSAVFGFAKISFLIKNSFGKNNLSFAEGVLWERGFAKNRSNPNLIKFDFYNLVSLINKFYIKWIATPLARNDKFNYIHAFSCALKNKFEIISRNENYAFDYNKYFCRNGNNRIDKLIRHYERKRSNLFCVDCFASIEARNDNFMVCRDDLFSRNDYVGKFIFGFGNNFNRGFLFNRKILKIKI